MKFSQLNEPETGGYTNTSNSFFLVIGIYNRGFPEPTEPGNTTNQNGILKDPSKKIIGVYNSITFYDYSYSPSSGVYEGFSHTLNSSNNKMWIPPGYNFSSFTYAIGFWFTAEEVTKYYLGSGK